MTYAEEFTEVNSDSAKEKHIMLFRLILLFALQTGGKTFSKTFEPKFLLGKIFS